MKLKQRMYGLVPYNLSPIQQGIQFGHAVVEYMICLPENASLTALNKWAKEDKTFMVMNGGTTNDDSKSEFYGTLNQRIDELTAINIPIAWFREPDLGDQVTAVVFLVDERVWDKETYPNFDDWVQDKIQPGEGEYLSYVIEKYHPEWTEFIGGEQNVKMREFLSKLRFA